MLGKTRLKIWRSSWKYSINLRLVRGRGPFLAGVTRMIWQNIFFQRHFFLMNSIFKIQRKDKKRGSYIRQEANFDVNPKTKLTFNHTKFLGMSQMFNKIILIEDILNVKSFDLRVPE